MRTSLTFGHYSGIPLKVHLNWFLVAILVTWSLAQGYYPQEYPGSSQAVYWIIGALTAMIFFSSVLLHELGHAIFALKEGVPVNSITLFILGGVAHIEHEPETPRAEFRIVAAGPLTSFLLGLIFQLLSLVLVSEPILSGAAIYLSRINYILAVFNLLPGFPLDGGRLLRALLWKLSGRYDRATRWASNAGFAIALLFVGSGVVMALMGSYLPGIWMAFIGWYLGVAAQEGYRQSMENRPEMDGDPLEAGPAVNEPLVPLFPGVQPKLATRVVLVEDDGLRRLSLPFVVRPDPMSEDYRRRTEPGSDHLKNS